MKKFLKRYRSAVVIIVLMLVLTLFDRELGLRALLKAGGTIKQMLLLLPPVFLILGLLDVWVPKELMMKYMGDKSGIKGVLLSILCGSVTSGPLYGAFPVVAVFMKKGASFTNVLIFVGAWSTTKVPMLLFEGTNLGWKFALTRLAVDIPGIIAIACAISAAVNKEEVEDIRRRCGVMDN